MADADLIPLSALQHLAYCPRQCALIHLDQAFDNNLQTLRGNALHARVDQPEQRQEHGQRVERALPLWHDGLGLIGKADVVEFAPDGTARPVEYKQGSRNKVKDIAACDDLQLAAQALCLEWMTGQTVAEGALFYATSKRRRVVPITDELRERVTEASIAVLAMIAAERLPPPWRGMVAQQRCHGCSLRERCQPDLPASSALRRAREALFDPDADL